MSAKRISDSRYLQRSVKRSIWLRHVLKNETELFGVISEIQGVNEIRLSKHKKSVIVLYDILQVSYLPLIEEVENCGIQVDLGWFSRVRANWFNYTDVNAKINGDSPQRPCCNRSPKR